jgi:hypothetical protein
VRIARIILVGLAWLFLFGVAVQYFLAGLGTLGGESMDAHEGLGYAVLHFFPILILIAALVARASKPTIIMSVVLVVVTLVQPFWVSEFRGEILGALHILGALVIAALAHEIASRATQLVRTERAETA